MSASLLWDSVNNHWIYQRESGAVYGGGMLISGPRNLGALGDEVGMPSNKLIMGIGGDHISSSNIYHNGTDTAFAGNLEVTGSTILATATITTLNAGNGVVSGSSQVVSILSSLNTYTGSNDTTNTAQSARLTTIESVTGSYETKGSGIVSGSSQITYANISSIPGGIVSGSAQTITNLPTGTVSGSSQINVMSTTNIARLATTGSNTFVGNQTISGSTIFRNNSNGTNVSIGGTAYGIRIDNGGTFSTGRSTIFGVDNTFLGSYQPLGLQGSIVYIGTSGTDIVTVESTGVTVAGNIIPNTNGTRDLGSSALRWSTIYTSDLSLNNGIGDWTIVEGEDDLFLYNNKKGKVYKFALTEVDPNVATPKKS
jgi:hypothetical protein